MNKRIDNIVVENALKVMRELMIPMPKKINQSDTAKIKPVKDRSDNSRKNGS